MIRIVFKNLERSELAKEAALERIGDAVERFPELKNSRLTVTLSMENSPLQAGPDLFTVKVYSRGGRYRDLTLEKSASSLYMALADIVEHLLERLNRFSDRSRVKSRNHARKFLKQASLTEGDI